MNEQKCFRTIIHLVDSLFTRCKHSLYKYVVVINNKHKKHNKHKRYDQQVTSHLLSCGVPLIIAPINLKKATDAPRYAKTFATSINTGGKCVPCNPSRKVPIIKSEVDFRKVNPGSVKSASNGLKFRFIFL